jgi:hypothetical protein
MVSPQKLFFNRSLQSILAIILLLAYGSVFAAASITVTASRNPVALDDTFHIIYEADSGVDDDPDFTPIYQHFDVLSSAQSTNMRSINGSWSLKKSWDLTVIAKQSGTFTLPPIKFGSDVSPAIKITVTSSSSPNSYSSGGQATVPAKIYLESEVDSKTGRVHQQLLYTVRLLRTVAITGASMTPPETSDKDAIIEQIAEDSYQTTRNGIRYEVYERRYAIFPQHSGKLKILPVTFEGRVNSAQAQTIFDRFRMSGQLKRLRSPEVEVNVQPVPGSINPVDWLPAGNVQLIEDWSSDIQNLKAGEPVTRTVTLIAQGQAAVQLPELEFNDIDGLKLYPDKAVSEDRVESDGLTAAKQYKIAIIPSRAGEYRLPAISINWWNTRTKKQETARLEETVIKVSAAASSPLPVAPVSPANQPVTTAEQATSVPAVTGDSNIQYWQWATYALAAAWLITLFLLLIRRNHAGAASAHAEPSLKQLQHQLIRAATQHDSHATQQALIQWARVFYRDANIANITHLAQRSSKALAEQCRKLSQAMYSGKAGDWQPEALIDAVKNEPLPTHETKSGNHLLRPLYSDVGPKP